MTWNDAKERRLDNFLRANAPEAPDPPLGAEVRILEEAERRATANARRLPMARWLAPVLALAAALVAAFLWLRPETTPPDRTEATLVVWGAYQPLVKTTDASEESFPGNEYVQLAAYMSERE